MSNVLLLWFVCSAHVGMCTRVSYVQKGLSSIPANGTSKITILDLKYNLIRRLVTDALITYPSIHKINLLANKLKHIDEGAFNGIHFLKTMYLSNNEIVALPSSFGAVTYTLEVLHVGSGFISQGINLTKTYFSEFVCMRKIRIGNNRLNGPIDTTLPPNVTFVYLSSPFIDIITFPHLAKYAPKIETFIVSNGGIESMPSEHLTGVRNVKVLNLENNRLTTVPDLYDRPLTQLKLAGNPLVCDKALCWIRMWPILKTAMLDNPTCASPAIIAGADLMDINPVDLQCYKGK